MGWIVCLHLSQSQACLHAITACVATLILCSRTCPHLADPRLNLRCNCHVYTVPRAGHSSHTDHPVGFASHSTWTRTVPWGTCCGGSWMCQLVRLVSPVPVCGFLLVDPLWFFLVAKEGG